jgi:6-pyruvoyl tetrahydropterin synthase/QueD family protein
MQIEFSRVFSAAHRIQNDTGKCSNIHGHNYRVKVLINADDVDANGFIIPFEEVKAEIDRFDHVLILEDTDPWFIADKEPGNSVTQQILPGIRRVPFSPSTENMAQHLARCIYGVCPHANLVRVELQETDNIIARAVEGK